VESPSIGTIVLIPFPFSDLSRTKLRPAIVLALAGQDDFVLCQVTSNPYSDPLAIALMDSSFARGSLARISFARPGKLFTAHRSLFQAQVGQLDGATASAIQRAVVTLFESSSE